MNISVEEYDRMVRVYQKSVRQTKLLQQLQEEFEDFEDLTEPQTHHNTYPAIGERVSSCPRSRVL